MNMFPKILQYSLLYFYIVLGVYCQTPEVQISQGRLIGDTRTNIDGGVYYSFKSIPYGKPPIGELRFKAPQPADAWEGTRDATQDIPACIQQGNAYGQEDCLYLNVYTPGLPEENITNLPVMVYIHGGGYHSNSATEMYYGGQQLLTKDIILVAINYRLGIFGFLSLDDPNLEVTGNGGLKDPVLALEWVRDNIENFGGDSNNVLIFGESAGGISVQFLLLSPMAKGLFHKAISQSGDATTAILDSVRRNTGAAIAEILGIQTENWGDMLVSLQDVSADDLALAEMTLTPEYYQIVGTGPIIEVPSNGSFLDRHPIDVIRSGDYNQVPLMAGITDAEGLLYQYLSRLSNGESILINDFTVFIPNEFNVDSGSILEELIAFVIRNFYYGDSQPSRDDITQAIKISSDYAFAFPAYRSTREYLKTAQNPIYFYYFTAITELNFFRFMDETVAAFPGAAHSDDLAYIFYMSSPPEPGSPGEPIMRRMVELFTNFAAYGNPTPEGSIDFVWEPVREDEFNYLEIATEGFFPVLNSVFIQDRMEFWWALYEEFSGLRYVQ